MKKNVKTLFASGLLAAALTSMTIGTTFALFTSEAKTEVGVISGLVKIESDIIIESVASLNPDDPNTYKISDTSARFQNGGTAEVVEEGTFKVVKIDKLTPGDQIKLTINIRNMSNVAIKSRFIERHTTTTNPDLYDALDIEYLALDDDDQDITYKFMDWRELAPIQNNEGYIINKVTATITFNNHEDSYDNLFQNTDCSLFFVQQAVQGNAHSMSRLEEMNAILEASEQVNATMFDALQELDVRASYLDGFVWDSQADRMAYEAEVEAGPRYFKVYDEMPEQQDFSIYANFDNEERVILNAVGFDAGNALAIGEVRYNGSENGQSVIIRTNGSDLVVNAPNDDVYHYGVAGQVHIIAVAGNSFHENAKVNGYIEADAGHLVFEGAEEYNVKVTSADVTAERKEQAEVNVYSDLQLEQEDFKDIKIHSGEELQEIETFAQLKAFVEAVNEGDMEQPVAYLAAGEFQFTETLNLRKTINLIGVEGQTRLLGFLNPEEKELDVCAFNVVPEIQNQVMKLSGMDIEYFGVYKAEGELIGSKVKAISAIHCNADISTETHIKNVRMYGSGVIMLKLVGGTYFVENCLLDASVQSYEDPNMLQVNANPYLSPRPDKLTNAHIKNCKFVNLSGADEDEFSATALSSYAESNLWVEGCEFLNCYVALWVFQTQPYHPAPELKELKDCEVINCTYEGFYDRYLNSLDELPGNVEDYEVGSEGNYTTYSLEKEVGGVLMGYTYYLKK